MLDHYNSLVGEGYPPEAAATLVSGFFTAWKLDQIKEQLTTVATSSEEMAGSLDGM
jgi:hypothetical protein